MFRKFFVPSVLALLICFSNYGALIAHEKSDQVVKLGQNQVGLADLPQNLQSLVKRTFEAEVSHSFNILTNEVGQLFAINKLRNLEATFTKEGALVESTQVENPWSLSLNLKGFGWANAVEPVESGILTSNKNRVEIDRGSVREWFVNDQRGLEQGFTIDKPPAGAGTQLVLELSMNSDWQAFVSEDKRSITLVNALGQSVDYSGLIAEDARGQALNTWFTTRSEKGHLICKIIVDVAQAQFPIIVDPIIENQKILSGELSGAGANFGGSVSISGETIVVGALGLEAAYIFVQTGGVWTQQAKLVANDGFVSDEFGRTVGISGETVIVGAHRDDDNGNGSGSAYIFVRTGTTWTQQAKLLPGDGAAGDSFGESVSISGETVVVGADLDSDNGTNSGSAYIFVRNGSVWGQQAKLLPGDGADGDFFGISVSISGETVVVGSPENDDNGNNSGSAYIFVRTGTIWTQQAKLVVSGLAPFSRFGQSVSISGETVVVGAIFDSNGFLISGSAYVFVRNGTVWTQQSKLVPNIEGNLLILFGASVSISGETVIVGAPVANDNGNSAGASYVFTRDGTVWSQQVKLLASDGAAQDGFSVVGISGETVVVGAPNNDDVVFNSGSAYIFDIFCQKDLGFQLGNLRLGICGQDLTKANSTATLCVSGAAPNAQIFLALGPTNNPMPLLGGFLVPSPFTVLGPFPADASGNFTLSLTGGNNFPFIFFLQAAAFNGPVFELSNALEVNIGS